MTERKDNGGPAFPLENPRQLENGDLFKQFPGMSLRDYAAIKALAALIASSDLTAPFNSIRIAQTAPYLAAASYVLADAMLAERAKA